MNPASGPLKFLAGWRGKAAANTVTPVGHAVGPGPRQGGAPTIADFMQQQQHHQHQQQQHPRQGGPQVMPAHPQYPSMGPPLWQDPPSVKVPGPVGVRLRGVGAGPSGWAASGSLPVDSPAGSGSFAGTPMGAYTVTKARSPRHFL